jgi:hypothetical protein
MRREDLYAGVLASVDLPGATPVPGLEVSRRVGPHATWFDVTLLARETNGWRRRS